MRREAIAARSAASCPRRGAARAADRGSLTRFIIVAEYRERIAAAETDPPRLPRRVATHRAPRPRVARLALATRAPPRLAPPPRRAFDSPSLPTPSPVTRTDASATPMGSAMVFVCARGRGDAKDARDRGTRATRRATGRDRSAPLAHVASRACPSLAAVARRSAADVRRHVGRRRSARRSERLRSRTRVALAYASKKLGVFFRARRRAPPVARR